MQATARRPGSDSLLAVEDLHVAYGKAEVVHGVSFQVRAGEFAVLLGRNGAGKSTILHAVSGLIPKAKGRVSFAGQDISGASPADIVRAADRYLRAPARGLSVSSPLSGGAAGVSRSLAGGGRDTSASCALPSASARAKVDPGDGEHPRRRLPWEKLSSCVILWSPGW